MRFDIHEWTEIELDVEYQNSSGTIAIMATGEVNLFGCNSGRRDILMGTGNNLRREAKSCEFFNVQGPKDVRVFLYTPFSEPIESVGVSHTNLERQPLESGNLFEVRKAVRQLKLESMLAMKEMRRVNAELQAQNARNVEKQKPVVEEGDLDEDEVEGEGDDEKTKKDKK